MSNLAGLQRLGAPLLPAKSQLTDEGILQIAGADARAFLQGQFTADLRPLDAARGTPTAWCNAQGRVLLVAWVLTLGDAVLLVLPRGEIERVQKRLRLFILRAQVTLLDLSQTWSVLGVETNTPQPPPLSDLLTRAPGTTASADTLLAYRLPGSAPRALVLGPQAALDDFWARCALPVCTPNEWTARDISLGLPRIDASTNEHFLPQQLNLDQLNGVSFDKGCYPGQEVIARLKYRGQVKARLRAGQSATQPTAGGKLYAPDGGAGRAAGEIVRAAAVAEGWVFSAVIDNDAALTLCLESPTGPVVGVAPFSGD
ncbi:MAG: folate-binding protein [Gammaproteobacteria bacterium]|nr:folate-binding protein [Gammaproteobacteria bacterium]